MKKLVLILIGLFGGVHLMAQSADIPFNGLIVDNAGKGIKARIYVKNSGKHTIANKNGQFGLTNIVAGDTLIVRFKKEAVEIPVGERRSLKITWVDNQPVYDEDQDLVDTGFGYIKRREYTSSSAGISGDEMIRKGFTNLQTAVLTMFPSVQLSGNDIVIRGAGSINSSNAALILYDNVQIQSLSNVNIHDVGSVEVQKGTNMYGLRGANGVIIIRSRSTALK